MILSAFSDCFIAPSSRLDHDARTGDHTLERFGRFQYARVERAGLKPEHSVLRRIEALHDFQADVGRYDEIDDVDVASLRDGRATSEAIYLVFGRVDRKNGEPFRAQVLQDDVPILVSCVAGADDRDL